MRDPSFYIWSAYAICVLVLACIALRPLASLRTAKRRARKLQNQLVDHA
ncbi:MAG: heme exporter protein CcmD [Pseudomonadales bacterium]|nr:heme exporter protein CcmD [Pseudomonadales bacterium]